VLGAFELEARDVATQTYPRKLDYTLLSQLAGLGASLSKFGRRRADSKLARFGEMFEPFGAKQVGSSAMPFKRNPVMSERICSLARLLPGFADVAWQNAATNFLERTLDDSANRRTILPEAILCTDEILSLARKVVEGLRIDERKISENLRTYGPFAGSEAVLMEAARAGGNRQELHEALRENAMTAYAALERGENEPALTVALRRRTDRPLHGSGRSPLATRSLDPCRRRTVRARRLAQRIRTTIGK